MKVCMIFTEGPHDVAFIRKVLTVCCNATEKTKIKLDEFPEPLASIFQEYVKNRDMQDLSLDMVQKFFLPLRVFDNLRNPSDIPTQAKQYKAILTSAGQGKSAGGSLNSILIKGKLITEDAFKGSEAVKNFVNFLNTILQ